MSRLLNGGFEQGFLNLFIDLIKGLAIVSTYHFGTQLVQKKGYMPEENYHTRWEKLFNYFKGFGGCLLAAVIISNWGHYRGITGTTLEAFCLLFIPCIAGIEHSYRVLKIPIKRSKRILLIIPILLLAFSSNSQVYKYKAFNTYFKYFDETGKAIKTTDSIAVDFLVVFNFQKNKINTYGKQEGNMDLISTLEDTTDQEGNVERIYTGIDQFGEKCEVHMKFYKSGYESDCILYYYYATPGVSMVYKLKKDL